MNRVLAGTLLALAACSGGESRKESPSPSGGAPPVSSPIADAGDGASTTPPADDAGVARDNGAPSDRFPAFAAESGQLQNRGGSVLHGPIIVTITWSADPNAALFERFGDEIGSTSYWRATTSEYGIGPAISGEGRHVRIAEAPPAQITDQELAGRILAALLDTAASKWPMPNDQTIYMVYLPAATKLIAGGAEACGAHLGGYHSELGIGPLSVAYAIALPCGGVGTQTIAASHELVEAATDPRPLSRRAYYGFDDAHVAWELLFQYAPNVPAAMEVGDACRMYTDSYYEEGASFPFWVQRQWSNAAEAAGHSPCVPAGPDPYFNVTPLALEDVTVDLRAIGKAHDFKTKGYRARAGEPRAFQLGFYSDAATSAPWSIDVTEGSPFAKPRESQLDIAVDLTRGVNGQRANVTVRVKSGPSHTAHLVTVTSKAGNGDVVRYLPIVVATD